MLVENGYRDNSYKTFHFIKQKFLLKAIGFTVFLYRHYKFVIKKATGVNKHV